MDQGLKQLKRRDETVGAFLRLRKNSELNSFELSTEKVKKVAENQREEV